MLIKALPHTAIQNNVHEQTFIFVKLNQTILVMIVQCLYRMTSSHKTTFMFELLSLRASQFPPPSKNNSSWCCNGPPTECDLWAGGQCQSIGNSSVQCSTPVCLCVPGTFWVWSSIHFSWFSTDHKVPIKRKYLTITVLLLIRECTSTLYGVQRSLSNIVYGARVRTKLPIMAALSYVIQAGAKRGLLLYYTHSFEKLSFA